MKVLFIHNSLPECRIDFWRALGSLVDLDICVTHPELQAIDYGFNFESNDGQIEVWGLLVNESLEAGVPVIATDCVGCACDIIDSSVGAVVPYGNYEALALAIHTILDATSMQR